MGSLLQCGGLVGETVREALPALTGRPVTIVWVAGRTAGHLPPSGSYYVAGGRVLARASISIQVTKNRPANRTMTDGHGRRC